MDEKIKVTNKCPICGRLTHKESKYCIFHASAEEKTEEEFKQALKKYVNKIKKEDGEYDFKKFIFIGDIDFKKDLNITVFKNARFSEATFEGYAGFAGATFERFPTFMKATFKGNAGFSGATIKGNADFSGATIEDNADFSGATIKRYAIFSGATFEEDAFFVKATFKGDADLELRYLAKSLIFYEVNVFPGKKCSINVNNEKGNISFKRAYLENTNLDIELIKDVSIDFSGALLRNTKIEKDQIKNHILQENEKKFTEAKEIFLLLRNNFHSIGRYEDESWAFKKEKDMERKSYFHFKSLHKWLWSCLLNGLFGYGEQPVKVIASAIIIILIFTFLFMSSGISDTSIGGFTSKNFLDCVYFSIITFTTLGYGDFRPVEGCGRIFAGTEAFIGASMMALFVYTFARRTGGR
ncbi:hypothetical protein ES708_10432 [subsurface metagenome]